jgi:hypothetical protein
MATPIVVNPTKPSQVVVNGSQNSGTPITLDQSIDWGRVSSIVSDAIENLALDDALGEAVSVYDDTISMQLQSIIGDV